MLHMHVMLAEVLRFHRTEGAQPHMQHDRHHIHAHPAHTFQKLRREMQACRRRGSAALLAGVDGLVAGLVHQFLMDVGREGHLAQPVQNLLEHALIVEAHLAPTVLGIVDDFRPQQSFAKHAHRAGAKPAARPDQRLPHVALQALEKQQLHRHAGVLLLAQQARGNHLRFIDDQRVARMQKLRQIVKMQVPDAAVRTVVHQQAAVIARLDRRLRDQFLRQLIIKIAGFHIRNCSPSSGGVCGLRPRCS